MASGRPIVRGKNSQRGGAQTAAAPDRMRSAGKSAAAKVRVFEVDIGLDARGNSDRSRLVALERNFDHAVRGRNSSGESRKFAEVRMNRDLAVSGLHRTHAEDVGRQI